MGIEPHRSPWGRVSARDGVALVFLVLGTLSVPLRADEALRASAPVATEILVLPARPTAQQETLVIEARVLNPTGVETATVWALGEGDLAYRTFPMSRTGGDRYAAELPLWDGRGRTVTYYVEATGASGQAPRSAGSDASPFVARLLETRAEARSARGEVDPVRAGIFAGLVVLFAGLYWGIRRRERTRLVADVRAGLALEVADREFWYARLAPLQDLEGEALEQALADLASRTHPHPTLGEIRVTSEEALGWLDEIRRSAAPVEDERNDERDVDASERPAPELAWDPRPAGPGEVPRSQGRPRGPVGGASGLSVPEVLVVLALTGIALGFGAMYLRPMEAPVRTSGELLEALLKQTRAKAIATTTPHRVRPITSTSLVVEYADSCSSGAWTLEAAMGLTLPDGVVLTETGWSVCFTSRGVASENLVLGLTHPRYGSRRIEVLMGGILRWLP